MSALIKAHCPSCGFQSDLLTFGSGWRNRLPAVPALGPDDKLITTRELDNESFRYYTDRSMYQDPIGGEGIQNEKLWLNPEGNYCPSCHVFSMRFITVGQAD